MCFSFNKTHKTLDKNHLNNNFISKKKLVLLSQMEKYTKTSRK